MEEGPGSAIKKAGLRDRLVCCNQTMVIRPLQSNHAGTGNHLKNLLGNGGLASLVVIQG